MNTGQEIHKMRRLSLSLPLTARTHVESVPAQLQRISAAPASASAAAGAPAPAFYLKDGGEGGWGVGREGEIFLLLMKWTKEGRAN